MGGSGIYVTGQSETNTLETIAECAQVAKKLKTKEHGSPEQQSRLATRTKQNRTRPSSVGRRVYHQTTKTEQLQHSEQKQNKTTSTTQTVGSNKFFAWTDRFQVALISM